MIKAVVFDFDGVLAESTDLKTQAFRALFEDRPEHLSSILALHEEHAGKSRHWKFEVIYRDILKQPLSDAERLRLAQRFEELVKESVVACPAVAGAEAFLASRPSQALYVASGTPQEELREIVERRGWAGYFRGVYGSPASKAEILNQVMVLERCSPQEVLMVGDARTDLEGARAAGTFFLGRWDPQGGTPCPFPASRRLADLRGLPKALADFARAVPVSVAICTYNGRSRGFLGEAVQSVLIQSAWPEEFLVLDDGSTDGTAEWLAQRYPQVSVHRQANAGLAGARNRCLSLTTCPYVAFLDDDDCWHPRKLERQLARLESPGNDAGGVYCALQLVDGRGRVRGRKRPSSSRVTWPEILLGNQVFGPSSMLLRRTVLGAVGDFRPGLGGVEDYDYWIRATRVAPLEAADEALVRYRVHSQQMSTGYAAMADQLVQVVDEHSRGEGRAFHQLALLYNLYGVLLMGLLKGRPGAVRRAWARLRELPVVPGLFLVRALGMLLAPLPTAQRAYRRAELAWMGRRLRKVQRL